MEHLSLAGGALQVSRVGFGCCPLGGHDWGTVDQEEILRAAHLALDDGINLFDTADVYGLGRSEEALARVLAVRRGDAVVATKFGVRHAGGKTWFDNSPGWIRQACEDSLRRLSTDVIDVYQVHYWDAVTDWDDIFATLEELRSQGKIRWVGISNVPESMLALRNLPDFVVSFQMQHSLVDRDNELFIGQVQRQWGLSFWSWGSLAQGLLSGKYAPGQTFGDDDRRSRLVYENFHGAKAEANQTALVRLRATAERLGRTPAQVAIRFLLSTVPHSLALTGVKSVAQVKENAGALGWALSAEDIAALKGEKPLIAR